MKCITQKQVSTDKLFKEALRQCIGDQIFMFRICNSNVTKCELCNVDFEGITTHVDHIYHFHNIVSDFLASYDVVKPTQYGKIPNTCMTKFRDEDSELQKSFQEFHCNNAKLRIICEK